MSDRLFERGEAGEQAGAGTGDNSPVELEELPEPARREKGPPTVVFSFDTDEQREELISILGLSAVRGGGTWTADWPPGWESETALRLDLDSAC